MIDKRYPRTLQEAFGPYTSNRIHEPAPTSSRLARWSYALTLILVAISCLVGLAACSGAPEYREQDGKIVCSVGAPRQAYQVGPGPGDTSFLRRLPQADSICSCVAP